MNHTDKQSDKSESAEKQYDIPVAGSLGLLALGAKGIELWRKKRNEFLQTRIQEKEINDSSNEKE